MLLHLLCMPRLRLQRLSRASSASAASALQRQVDELQGGLIALRGAMDARVVGHDDIKHAVLLGLLSKEHVYIEGPPGVAKTMLAEVIVQAAGLKPWFYQMHRDTRLSELIGDSVIIREPHDGGSGGAGEHCSCARRCFRMRVRWYRTCRSAETPSTASCVCSRSCATSTAARPRRGRCSPTGPSSLRPSRS